MSTFGERIKQAREAKKWSQADLAQTLDVSTSAIRDWEARERSPRDWKVYRALAEALGITADQLLDVGGAGDRGPDFVMSLGDGGTVMGESKGTPTGGAEPPADVEGAATEVGRAVETTISERQPTAPGRRRPRATGQ